LNTEKRNEETKRGEVEEVNVPLEKQILDAYQKYGIPPGQYGKYQ
jgi:hypothetical protein